MKLVTTSPGGWWVGGLTKTKLMLFSTQVEVVVELKLELSLAILNSTQVNVHSIYIFSTTSPGWWSDKTKVILNSTQVKVEV